MRQKCSTKFMFSRRRLNSVENVPTNPFIFGSRSSDHDVSHVA